MNQSQRLLLDYFPDLDTMDAPADHRMKVFYELYHFLSQPSKKQYDLQAVMQLDHAADIQLFLKVLETYFYQDSYVKMEPPEPLLIKETAETTSYLSQTDFSRFLIQEGYSSWKPNKVTTYYGRGKLPSPDLMLSNKPYWSKRTAQQFSDHLSVLIEEK